VILRIYNSRYGVYHLRLDLVMNVSIKSTDPNSATSISSPSDLLGLYSNRAPRCPQDGPNDSDTDHPTEPLRPASHFPHILLKGGYRGMRMILRGTRFRVKGDEGLESSSGDSRGAGHYLYQLLISATGSVMALDSPLEKGGS
jgi:hypothetical protein